MGIDNKDTLEQNKVVSNMLEEVSDPDHIVDLILKDIGSLLTTNYQPHLENTNYFNIHRLEFLLGGQFRISKMAREEGYIIEDCEMCTSFDRDLSYCQHYHIMLTYEKERHYYYAALCPALLADC
ncbi:hypothetical protein [Anaerospora sp.]|uniref:hypothetical protein n=1 Tax=Anaerospora sp. TaxID=1960278 RepID=UPI002898B0DE|nr:hypothetical protein [Anaerospora sp.]